MKLKKLHNILASVFAATMFAAPSTSAGLWSNIRSFFGTSSSSSNNTSNDKDNNNAKERTNQLIEKLISQNGIPVFSTSNGKQLNSSTTIIRLSYDHYNSIIFNKDLNSKLKIEMLNKSDLKPDRDILLILSKKEEKIILDNIKKWEENKKYYRENHEYKKSKDNKTAL